MLYEILNTAISPSRCGTAGGVGLTRSGGWARMCGGSIIGEMRQGGAWNYIAGREKIEEMAGSSGRVYIQSLLPIYRFMCNFELAHHNFYIVCSVNVI